MKEFKGRIVASGTVTAKALVSHGGLNTLASFQKALQFGDKKATCGDQNNPDLYGKQMAGKALCLPTTIGSTTGGLVLYCACSMNRQPACMLFSLSESWQVTEKGCCILQHPFYFFATPLFFASPPRIPWQL